MRPDTQEADDESQEATPDDKKSVAPMSKLCSITPGELIPPSCQIVPAKNSELANESLFISFPSQKIFSENVKWNIRNKITRKIGIPAHLFVNTLSILSDFE